MNKNLRDLIDLEKVSRLLEGFNKSTGFVTAILDLEGNVLSKSGWRQICTEFHRVDPKTSERCTYSDTVLAGKMEKGEKHHAYTCLNGLTDVAVPIVINGQHVGNLFSGQFLLEEPDIDFFKKQANKFGFDEKEYIKALSEVPVIAEGKVKTVMDFLLQMTNLISELGVEKTEQVELNKRLRVSKNELKAANQQLIASNQQLGAIEQQLRASNQQLEASNKELIGKEQLLSSIFNTVGDVLFLIDAEAESKFRFKYINQAFIDATGLSRSDIEGKLIEEVIPEPSIHIVKENYLKSIKEKKLITWEDTSEYPAGVKIGIVSIVPVFDEKGNCRQLVGSVHDITKRKQAEDVLHKRVLEQEMLLKISQSVNSTFDLETVLQVVSDGAAQLLDIESAAIYLLEGEELLLGATTPPLDPQMPESLRWAQLSDHPHIQKAVSTRLPVILDDTRLAKLSPAEKSIVELRQLHSIIYLPFQNKGDVIGLLILGTISQLRKFSDSEINLCQTISNQLVLGIQNARLYANLKKNVDEIKTQIADRKQAEEELTKLSTAVTQSPSVIAITDTDGKLEYVNPKFTEITGYSLEEVIGQNPRVLKSGEQSDEMYKELWETISSGNTWRGEFHNKKKNGELFWEMASVSPISDEQGKIINYIKVAEDITERKQAEDNFRHSIDDSPLGIRIVNQAGRTIYVNKVLLDIYEFSSLDELINTKAIDQYTEKSYQEHLERKKIRHEGGDASEYEISIRRKNGEIRHIKVWRKEVIWNREKHFQVINQDITELKQLNTDLILAKEKAEESNRLKSAFLANMSHEIRTPMNGILGFAELLKEPHLDGDEKEKYIEVIEKSGNRMLNTINDIVDISKIEAGQVKVEKTEVSINKILDEQHSFFLREANSKGLELYYSPTVSDNESCIFTDKLKLEGILTNLITNAIKYTQVGSITFGYAIKTLGEKDVVEFYVKDTGIGIPANRLDAIFNRFEQAEVSNTRVFEGSGLGLAISKSYVEMLGGKIRVSSEEGSGSTFTFSIPYNKQNLKVSGAIQNKEEESKVSMKNLSVIVAEDDETCRMLLETILKNHVKRITYTTTGKETIEKFRENPDTDIILMDIKMADMNGYDSTREIRKFNSDVVIIAQTAFGFAGDKEKALEAGCDDYIAKPIKKEILIEKIRACLDIKRI